MLSDALLASIYAVVTDDNAMATLSSDLAQALDYNYGLIMVRGEGLPPLVSINQPLAAMVAYNEHYFRLDPWARLAMETPFGQVLLPGDADASFYDSEFYVDFARPMGVIEPVGVRMALGNGTQVQVALNQSLHAHGPDHTDGQILVTAASHLQRALQLRQHFFGLRADKAVLNAAFDRLDFGMVICTADGRISAMNKPAEDAIAIGCGLRTRNGFLVAEAEMAGPLALLIRDASNGGPGDALRLRAGDHRWTTLIVAPLPPQVGWEGGASRTLVAFRPPQGPIMLDARLLMSAFALSRSEAQVAIGLVEGRSLEDLALVRGVKPSTIKSQLNAIFEKTDTRSQRELVRMLSALPAIRLA